MIEGYWVRISPAVCGLPIGAYLRIRPMAGELSRVSHTCVVVSETVPQRIPSHARY